MTRRADRLFQIVQILRSGRLVTAAVLSEKLEVSERTIYRDIADLQGSGVPIEGEAGIGYMMRDGYDLPPIMFTRKEIEALIVGARLVSAWSGAEQALNIDSALSKIETILPDETKQIYNSTSIFAMNFEEYQNVSKHFDTLNEAISNQKVICIDYTDLKGLKSKREIEPLALHFWGNVWTLAAWCRLREDFRVFRIDLLNTIQQTGEIFQPTPGKTLQDFLHSRAKPTTD